MDIKQFIQILLFIGLYLIVYMTHYGYYKYPEIEKEPEKEMSIYYFNCFVLAFAFSGFYYTFYRKLNKKHDYYLLTSILATYAATILLLYQTIREDKRFNLKQIDVSILIFIVSWLSISYFITNKSTERVFSLISIVILLIMLLYVIPEYRDKKITDHPGYAIALGAWILLAYRISK